jgi:photosystem II stability/assembly factor-like uncharacterized protein
VYRTRNGGKSWQAMTRGLPQKGALETVVRDAMSVDSLEPAGVYFGTRSGRLYASRDEGQSWRLVADGLPPIVCVKTAVAANCGAKKAAAKRRIVKTHARKRVAAARAKRRRAA